MVLRLRKRKVTSQQIVVGSFLNGSTATGSDNTNSQPEVIECHRRLKDTIDVPTGRQVTIGTGRQVRQHSSQMEIRLLGSII